MKYIDSHCHVFPDALAPKVVSFLSNYYHAEWERKGTYADLCASMDEGGVSKSVIFSSATRADQVSHINQYLAGLKSERFIVFGTMHPDSPHLKEDLDELQRLGLEGIKIHPDFLKIPVDDIRMMHLFELLPDNMPIMIHVGDEDVDYSHPKRLAHVLDTFPNLHNIIAAHMGGYVHWKESEDLICGRDVWLDTSSTLFKLEPERVIQLAHAHGIDRVLFGTDYPFFSHRTEIHALNQVGFTQEELEKLYYRNAERLFGVGI